MAGKPKKKVKRKGKKGKRNAKKPINRAGQFISSDVLSDILYRISVKNILRFILVCRQWEETISTSHFMVGHFRRYSSFHRGLPIMLQTYSDDGNTILYYSENKLIELLKNPFSGELSDISIVGPLNGVLLLFQSTKLYSPIILWNPVVKKSELFKLPRPIGKEPSLVSVGLGFDFQKYNFCIVRVLVHLGQASEFEVFSLNRLLGNKSIKSNVFFYMDRYSCDTIIQGEPYWLGYNVEDYIPDRYDCVLHFIPSTMEFEVFDLPFISLDLKKLFAVGASQLIWEKLVEFNDTLGFLTWQKSENTLQFWSRIDNTWELRDTTQFLGIEKIFGCLRNGTIVAGEKVENKKQLIRIYEENPKEFYVEGKLVHIFDFLGSLVITEGMEPVTDQYDIRDFVL